MNVTVTPKEYNKIVKDISPQSNTVVNCAKAFVFGGAICTAGQGIFELFTAFNFDGDTAKTLTSVTMIALGVLLTALGLYDKIARQAGAGTLVPITGFANSVCAPAVEFRTEGYITGVGAKIFIISGPVILYGTLASIAYGLIYYIFK